LSLAGDKIKNSFETAKGAMKEAFSLKRIGANLRGMVQGIGSKIAGIFRKKTPEEKAEKKGGGIGGLLGPMALLMGFLLKLEPVQKAIQKAMDVLTPIMNKVGEALVPLVDAIMGFLIPIFDTLVESLIPVVEGIIKAIMPILQRLIGALMPLFNVIAKALGPVLSSLFQALMPLVNFLLPPLLYVLGFLIEGIGLLVGSIERLLGNNNGLGEELAKAGNEMRRMAFAPVEILPSPEFQDSIEDGVSNGMQASEIKQSWSAAEWQAGATGIREVQQLSLTTSGSTQTTEAEKEEYSSEAALAAERQAIAAARQAEAAERQAAAAEITEAENKRRHEELMSALIPAVSNSGNSRALYGNYRYGGN